MCRIENYLNNEGKELLENLNDNMWEGNQFDYQIHGLLVINEYINVELMCLENEGYKHLFDFFEFKKAIVCEHKVNEFFDEMKKLEIEYPSSNHHLSVDIIEIMSEIYGKLIEKLEYLSEEINSELCKYCGDTLENNLYGNVCARHYSLWDEPEEDNSFFIYPEYTYEEMRDIEYEEEKNDGLGYYQDECDEFHY